jgi:hypothetical protein
VSDAIYPPSAENAIAGRLTANDVAQLREAFAELKRDIKKVLFNKHRPDEFRSYIEPAHRRLAALLEVHERLELKLEVSTIVIGNETVLEDDQREANLVFPLWNEGVRLLSFQRGVRVEDLMNFLDVLFGFTGPPSSDILSSLWKAELVGIEWVALSDFQIGEGDDNQDIEVEVEEVLSYLQSALTSEAGDGAVAAKVSLADLDLKLEDVERRRMTEIAADIVSPENQARLQQQIVDDERRLLDKICGVVFEVMTLEARESELEDIAAALEQLLDGLILEGKFGTINRVIEYSESLSYRSDASTANRDLGRRIAERMMTLIQQPERVRGVSTALNAGRVLSLDELRVFLKRLGPTSVVVLLELLDGLNNPTHRRAICDVLINIGGNAVPLFANRIKTASSNLAKDLFFVIGGINPPNKIDILEPALNSENAILRMEVLNVIASSKDEKSFRLVEDVFKSHEVAQMRAHAARMLANFEASKAANVLLAAAKADTFDTRPEGEQRAIYGSLAQIDDVNARKYLDEILGEKSGLFAKRKVDERKLLVIRSLAANPGIPSMKQLSVIAQDTKTHSKDVVEAARDATLKMREKLLGDSKGGAS